MVLELGMPDEALSSKQVGPLAPGSTTVGTEKQSSVWVAAFPVLMAAFCFGGAV